MRERENTSISGSEKSSLVWYGTKFKYTYIKVELHIYIYILALSLMFRPLKWIILNITQENALI